MMFGTGAGRTAKIELTVSLDNECTAAPWWFILDPKQNMSCDLMTAATQITGPFFSRESAEWMLKIMRHHYSKRAVVWCHSGCYSPEYEAAYKAAESTPC